MIGGPGVGLSLRGRPSNVLTLQAGDSYIIPSGKFLVVPGLYTWLQFLDPVTGIWRSLNTNNPNEARMVESDGTNYRLANLTGCVVGAVITTALATGAVTGIGVTACGMTVTPSAGNSTWCPIIGGAISTTVVTGVTGATGVTADPVGAGYLYPPTAIISPPPPGGLQATAHVTGIPTTGALLAAQLIIDNQGAGYTLKSTGFANASVTFINDPRDTVGTGATVRLGLTGTGALTGLYPLNNGTPLTAVPTFTFGVGAAAATSIMNFTVTAFATGLTGVVFLTLGAVQLISVGHIVAGTPAWTNPLHEKGLTNPRPARISIAAGGTVTTTGAVIEDGGLGIQAVPILTAIGNVVIFTGVLTGAVANVATVGGVTDTSWLQPL